MFDRFRHAVLRPTDASFFLNQKRYRAIICCICIGISLFEWSGIFDQLFPGTVGRLIAIEYLLSMVVMVFFPVPAGLVCMITYCCLLFSPTYAAANICWGMLLSIFYIAFHLRRWASGGVLCLLLIAEFVETKLVQDPIDSFIGFASSDIVVFCIGVLLATTERTAQAKQVEHNLRIASHLHSAVTSELSSIILMARSGSKDNGTLERIETVARLSLANMHSIIRTLSDTGNADTDESHKSPDITAYAQALDHNAQSMGFTGRLSIRLDSFPVSNSQFMLIQLCIKELYANITRHMAKNGGEYSITISGSENSIRITETNPSSGNPNELTSGFGLSLLEHQLEVSGGAIRYGLSGSTWHVEVTIPSGLTY
ncbi:hypothetical protein [Bifidobacterium angulatum]|uniref:hypothetical protein n=1 Tax=Bifidobacterium angulatum TaxID=1683 RepID=UPI0005F92A11|nr:hypothetical protein [Bifidobacterium angulatum]AMK57684.1 hypothetical protein Bang102_003900 [Bifidobacterium angulatum]